MLLDFYARFVRDDTTRLAASLAFYTIFAITPVLLLLTALASSLGLEVQTKLIEQVRHLVSPEAASAIQLIMSTVGKNGNWKTFASGGLVWAFSASVLFLELRVALNRIFFGRDVLDQVEGFWPNLISFVKTRISSIVLVFSFTIIALISLFVSSYIVFAFRHQSGIIIQWLNISISLLVYFVAFLLAYRYVPSRRVQFRRAFFGAALTSLLFETGKELIALYLGKTAFGSAFGAAGSVVIMVVWVYYSSLIVFAGAQLTMVLLPDKIKKFELGPERIAPLDH